MLIKLHRNTLPIFSFFIWKKVILYGWNRHRCKHKVWIHLACYYMCVLKGKTALVYNTGFYSLYLHDLPFFSLSNFCSRLVVWGHTIFSSLFVSYTELSFGRKRKLSSKSKRSINHVLYKIIKILKGNCWFFSFKNSSLLITRSV